jgi:hypothetical protein
MGGVGNFISFGDILDFFDLLFSSPLAWKLKIKAE